MGHTANYFDYLEHQEHDQPFYFLCEKCGELFYSIDNKEYVVDKEIKNKWDMFGDLESSTEYGVYKVIYRCPYCKWKHKYNIPKRKVK